MNPFTRHLLRQIARPEEAVFVQAWDAVEALIVRVYRSGLVGTGDEEEWRALRRRLRREYSRWRAGLARYWRATRVAGLPLERDPFEWLLRHVQAREFIDDWTAMQSLPAAREALNTWLRDLAETRAEPGDR